MLNIKRILYTQGELPLMTEQIFFLTDNKITKLQNGKIEYLTSQPLETYKRNIREIQKKNEWKTAGSGALFMRGETYYDDTDTDYAGRFGGLTKFKDNEILYTLNIESNTGLHIKNILDEKEPESFIIRKNHMNIFTLDYQTTTGRIAVCASNESSAINLAIFNDKNTDYQFITEGDCLDQNPTWSKTHPDTVYYDSCGIARDNSETFIGFGPRSVYKLNINTGDLTEIITDEKLDFIKPQEDQEGNLYYLKKPYKSLYSKEPTSLKDIIMMPVKLAKAIFGWLNFFTQRYAGQSLKTSGSNPAKNKEKDPQELFVEGNLINVLKEQKENEKQGEQYPGFAPKNWELIKKTIDGNETVIKTGLLDYHLCENGDIIYSNGNYLIKLTNDGTEKMLTKTKMATSIITI